MATTQLSRHIRAPRARVYRALIDPEAVQRWMAPDGTTSEIHAFDAREGGAIRISLTYDTPTTAGKTTPHTDTFHGRFVKLVPDAEVVLTLELETDDPAMRGSMTVAYLLHEAGDGCLLHGVHQGLPAGVPPQDDALGWGMPLDKLAALVENP